MKKKMAIVVLAMVLAGFMTGTSWAAIPAGCYICNVKGVGTNVTSTGVKDQICLTDINGNAAVQQTWFNLDTTAASKLLASGLTAISSTLKVYVYLGTNPVAGQTTGKLFVVTDDYQ
jgi:hypothetical protein